MTAPACAMGLCSSGDVTTAVYTLNDAARLFGITPQALYATYVEGGTIRLIVLPQGRCLDAVDVERVSAQRQERAAALAALPVTDLYTAAQACAHLGVTTRTFWRWVHAGKFHPMTVPHGRMTYYHKEEIHQWKAQRQVRLDAAQVLPDDVYTLKQVCQLLGMGRKALATWIRDGKFQRRWLPQQLAYGYLKADIDALAQEQKDQPQPVKGHPDATAFAQLYASVWQLPDAAQPNQRCPLVRFLCRRYRVPVAVAEDALQQALVRLWDEGSDFFARYPTVSDQRCALVLRCQWQIQEDLTATRARHKRTEQWEAEWLRNRVPTVEAQVLAREQCRAVIAQAQQLPQKQQRILQLMAQGCTETEMAADLGLEGETVTATMVRYHHHQVVMKARQTLHSWQDAEHS